jgi:hypothetical protein
MSPTPHSRYRNNRTGRDRPPNFVHGAEVVAVYQMVFRYDPSKHAMCGGLRSHIDFLAVLPVTPPWRLVQFELRVLVPVKSTQLLSRKWGARLHEGPRSINDASRPRTRFPGAPVVKKLIRARVPILYLQSTEGAKPTFPAY